MQYIYDTILNLECNKCARMRFHCANDLVVLRMPNLGGSLLRAVVLSGGVKRDLVSKNAFGEYNFL